MIYPIFLSFFHVFWERIWSWRSHPWKIFSVIISIFSRLILFNPTFWDKIIFNPIYSPKSWQKIRKACVTNSRKLRENPFWMKLKPNLIKIEWKFRENQSKSWSIPVLPLIQNIVKIAQNLDKIFNHFSRKSSKNHIFSEFSLIFFMFFEREFHVVGGTLWKYFWQNSETIFVTKFFSRARTYRGCDSDSQALDSNNVSICSHFKVLSNSIHFLTNSQQIGSKFNQILCYPLLKIHRKSMKFDNKFMKNQWKSMKSLAIFERKSAIFQQNWENLTSNWPHFDQIQP